MTRSRSDATRIPWIGALLVIGLIVFGALPGFSATIFAPDIPTLDPQSGDADGAAGTGQWDSFGATSDRSSFTNAPHTLRISSAPGDAVSLARTTAFSPTPDAIACTFNISLSGSGGASAQMLRFGSRFSTSNADEGDANTYGQLDIIPAGSGSGFQVRDLAAGRNSPGFTGTQAITWALNNSGRTLSYGGPNGKTESIANDRMDVWVGSVKVFDDIAVTSPGVPMTNLKWFWGSGGGTTTFTSFQVAALQDLREGAATGAAAPAPEASVPPESGSLELYRPTPNPFERTMRFAYAVPARGERVEIGMYDVAGRRIRTFVSGTPDAGRYELSWDGRGDGGARARAGIYFLRAAIGSTSRVVRVVYLLK